MKYLTIARHAKSDWNHPNLADYERPLNKRGLKDAPEMGRRLAETGFSPDLIISSPAKRAITTARKIAKQIGYNKEAIVEAGKFYGAGYSEMLRIIASFDDQYEHVMIFGHNPCWTVLVNQLTGNEIPNVPTCGIVRIEFDADTWNEVVPFTGNLLDFDYPRKTSE